MKDTLHADLESRSVLDLNVVGLDRYVNDPSTEVILFAYALNEDPVEIWEPHLGLIPEPFRRALLNPEVRKSAWQSQFERTMIRVKLGLVVPYEQWEDPQIHARMMSMPGSLEDCGRIVGIKEGKITTKIGKESLVKFFCEPVHEGGQENLFGVSEPIFRDWTNEPENWRLFKEYCKQDVRAEREIGRKLAKYYPFPEIERRGFILDQKINDAGIPCDLTLVNGAMKVAEQAKAELGAKLKTLTGLENTNSNPQMLEWVRNQGYPFNSLGKGFVTRAFDCPELTPAGREALTIRKESSKTSDSKLDAIAANVGPDGRLRYQFSYLGSSRAGRWSAKAVQPHNMPRPEAVVKKNLARALALLSDADFETIKAEFPSPINVVVSALRSVFKAPAGKHLVVCDLSGIEFRVLGYLAGSDAIRELYRKGLDPYKDFATSFYGVAYEDVTELQRQDSKPPILGAGYRLSGGEESINADGDVEFTGLIGYAKNLGIELTPENSHKAVKVYRDKYPEVVRYWYRLEEASQRALFGVPTTVGPIRFEMVGKVLCVRLPSGRSLHYINPKIEKREFYGGQKDTLVYDGVDITTKQWTRITTHGGKLTENLCQAVARDVLLFDMLRSDEKGFQIVMHCHDEIVCEMDKNSPLGLAELKAIMETSPPWASDLPLGAEGYIGENYRK